MADSTVSGPGVVYLVDRPVRGKCLIYAPVGVLPEMELRTLVGSRARIVFTPFPDGHAPTHVVVTFSRRYFTVVVTYLRSRADCESVRVRTAYQMNRKGDRPRCTPQCEGAWTDGEKSENHEDSCACPCGGLRHGTARPWWLNFEVTETTSIGDDAGFMQEVRVLPPTNRVNEWVSGD